MACMAGVYSDSQQAEKYDGRSLLWRVRSGAEESQFNSLLEIVQVINLVPCEDKYFWSLESEWDYSVASIRKLIDEKRFQEVVCKGGVETTSHLFFQCVLSKQIMRKVSSWWNVDYTDVSSYEEWRVWLVSIRIPNKMKSMMEGVFYAAVAVSAATAAAASTVVVSAAAAVSAATAASAAPTLTILPILALLKNIEDNAQLKDTVPRYYSHVLLIRALFTGRKNQVVDTIVGDQEDPDVKGKQEVKKVDDREIENIKDEEGKNVEDQQVCKQAINETANTITSLQSEVASLEAKRSLDANEEIKETHTRVYELEKQKVKTKCALKIDDEEFKKAKSEATRKIVKLAKVYGAWLPPWLTSRLVVYQPYVKNHIKESMFIQGRI
nr:RNA-directed DNA polymerase, eukaryota [Tanacetum cinerariifolium]